VHPATTFSLVQDLIHRDGLRTALSGRDDVLLEPVLSLLLRHIADPRFAETVCDIATLVIGGHATNVSITSITYAASRDVYPCAWPVTAHRFVIRSATQESLSRDSFSDGAVKNEGCP
jgi:hypothetical protein